VITNTFPDLECSCDFPQEATVDGVCKSCGGVVTSRCWEVWGDDPIISFEQAEPVGARFIIH